MLCLETVIMRGASGRASRHLCTGHPAHSSQSWKLAQNGRESLDGEERRIEEGSLPQPGGATLLNARQGVPGPGLQALGAEGQAETDLVKPCPGPGA